MWPLNHFEFFRKRELRKSLTRDIQRLIVPNPHIFEAIWSLEQDFERLDKHVSELLDEASKARDELHLAIAHVQERRTLPKDHKNTYPNVRHRTLGTISAKIDELKGYEQLFISVGENAWVVLDHLYRHDRVTRRTFDLIKKVIETAKIIMQIRTDILNTASRLQEITEGNLAIDSKKRKALVDVRKLKDLISSVKNANKKMDGFIKSLKQQRPN